MNHAIRASIACPRTACPMSYSPVSFFHSTPVSERKRRTSWHSRFNYYAKRRRNIESKRTLLRNMSEYAEYLFESWRRQDEGNTRDGAPWFRMHHGALGSKKNGYHVREPHQENYNTKRRGAFVFCSSDDDNEEVETIFRSAFGGARYSYWSFNGSENFHWRNSSGHAYTKNSQNWRYESDDEADTSPQSEFASERLALGLSAFGPLKLKEVKNAYRACALRWHPDRHQGSSKVAAEEKFKHCSAAYKTLCDSLAVS